MESSLVFCVDADLDRQLAAGPPRDDEVAGPDLHPNANRAWAADERTQCELQLTIGRRRFIAQHDEPTILADERLSRCGHRHRCRHPASRRCVGFRGAGSGSTRREIGRPHCARQTPFAAHRCGPRWQYRASRRCRRRSSWRQSISSQIERLLLLLVRARNDQALFRWAQARQRPADRRC